MIHHVNILSTCWCIKGRSIKVLALHRNANQNNNVTSTCHSVPPSAFQIFTNFRKVSLQTHHRASVSYLDQQSDGATLVHFQDLTILGPHQDVAMAQRYGTNGGVVLQEQPCRVHELQPEDLSLSQDVGGQFFKWICN